MLDLKQFYQLMQSTISPRRRIVDSFFDQSEPLADDIDTLNRVLCQLNDISDENHNASLRLDDQRTIEVNLDYEITELQKDLIFIDHGENDLRATMRQQHKHMDDQIQHVLDALHSTHFYSMITDRDGTINNYCGRYLSSIQSAYNAIFVTRFANTLAHACVLTSAPLSNPGLINISVMPSKHFTLAGSKGREALTRDGQEIHYAADPMQTAKQLELNHRLQDLLKKDNYEKFLYIGSGLQIKFGQTAIARQDISHSIDENESLALLEQVQKMLNEIDPDQTFFRIEDTGKDIEVQLTIGEGDAMKDFDKGDGLAFLNEKLDMKLDNGPCLICGDTFSDAPMITAAQKLTQTHSIFVTTDDKLKQHVLSLDPNALFVDAPDVIVTAMNILAKKS